MANIGGRIDIDDEVDSFGQVYLDTSGMGEGGYIDRDNAIKIVEHLIKVLELERGYK